ncbi:MAG: tetratricopeptide repeat protein [Acidobacteriota bacterium]|nr:tetratricopeptide repeat protein [Acidobacteriota bacterium]
MSRFINKLRNPLLALAVLLILGTTATESLEAQAHGRLALTVVDDQGNALEGASIVVTCDELKNFREEQTTSKKGKATIGFKDATKFYNLKVSISGYSTLEAGIKPEVRTTTKRTVTLVKRGAPQAAGPNVDAAARSFSPTERAFNQGVEALRVGDSAGAKEGFLVALEKNPDFVEAHAALSGLYLDEGDFAAALAAADRVVELRPEDPRGYFASYDAHKALGNADEAAAALEALKRLDTGEGTAAMIYNEGVGALKRGNDAGAAELFREALEMNPDLVPAMSALGGIYMNEGKFAEALSLADRIEAVEPDNPMASRLHFDAYSALGEKEKAQEAFERLADLDPVTVGKRFYDMGLALFKKGDMAQAIEAFERALGADESLIRAHYHLGLCYVNRGNNAKALANLQAFLAKAPENDPERSSAAEMLQFLGG